MDDLKNSGTGMRGELRYRSLAELARRQEDERVVTVGGSDEFPPGAALPFDVPGDGLSRRRFLSLMSASAALALGTSCSSIDRGSIVPYTRRPQEIIPGVATYYASTFQEGVHSHGVLVKTREGRPIHIEGNTEHPFSRGKAGIHAVADVLGLYDPDRLRSPSFRGSASTWDRAEEALGQVLKQARETGRPVLLLTEAVISPTRRALIEELKMALPGLRHAAWEPAVDQTQMAAAQALYGEVLIPEFHFDRADVIVSFQADFLGAGGSVPVHVREFAARRTVSSSADAMNRLWVLEGPMTLTGANADQRLQVRPSRVAPLMFATARFLNELYGLPLPVGLPAGSLSAFDLDTEAAGLGLDLGILRALADDLRRAGKRALVVAGAALPLEAHMACHLLNWMLGAEGNTVDTAFSVAAPQLLTFDGLRDLLEEAARGSFAAALFWGANPGYAFPDPALWERASAGIAAKFRIGLYEDETALSCDWRLPESHWLESWGDFEPAANLLSLRQPTIGAIHDTRQGEDVLLMALRAIAPQAPAGCLEYMKSRWQKEVYAAGGPVTFEVFWEAALHDGVLRREVPARPPRVPRSDALRRAAEAAASTLQSGPAEGMELVLLPGAGVHDGRYANNGWLNELPDPVTKATWGNPVLLSISDAETLGVVDGDLIAVSAGSAHLQVPAILQPGQTPGVACLALGYGRRTGNVAAGIGANSYILTDSASTSPHLRTAVTFTRAGGRQAVPRTQEHFRMEGRDPARSWTLAEYRRRQGHGADAAENEHASLIPAPVFPGPKWGMAIDLSACTGCSACLVACQSENNIAVVGPERVEVSREMHWIRIDRYYEGDPRRPSVLHQPVPCQHCDDAPCEIVCPVNATTHSPDGLNQMAYNRCVGTRYCSNNCPFKVRRFNFFDYTSMKKEPESLVFNPEVTVRPRGVMEKCSFCIQRIEDVKQRANVAGRAIRDGEIRPACAAACPAEAIVFGDLHDPLSRVAGLAQSNRGYRMLVELGIRPSVTYLADISNPLIGKG